MHGRVLSMAAENEWCARLPLKAKDVDELPDEDTFLWKDNRCFIISDV